MEENNNVIEEIKSEDMVTIPTDDNYTVIVENDEDEELGTITKVVMATAAIGASYLLTKKVIKPGVDKLKSKLFKKKDNTEVDSQEVKVESEDDKETSNN